MTTKSGRPSGRPSSFALILGHLGASPEGSEPGFSSSPRPPLLQTARGSGGLLTLTLRGKAADGLEEQQERTRPQLSHRAWKTGWTDAGFPQRQQAAALRRVVLARSLSFSTKGTKEHAISGVRDSEGIDFTHLPPSTFNAAQDIALDALDAGKRLGPDPDNVDF